MAEKVKVGDPVETFPQLGVGEVLRVKQNTVIVRYEDGTQLEHRTEEVRPAG